MCNFPSRDRASSNDARKPRRQPPFVTALLLLLLAVATGVVPAQEAPDEGSVTPQRLAEYVPENWQGLESTYAQNAFDRSGAAMASASYDDPGDERASTDLSLGLTDLGPYREAALLAREADVAAGRAERTDIGGYPAFVVTDEFRPAVEVLADRIWIRANGFGPVFDAEAVQAAVAELPLDEIAALSEGPIAAEASYAPTGFTIGGLRSFLPEELLGMSPPEDSFYAEVHPTGVAWSGFPYEGQREGEDVRVRVTIWDLGTIADEARERLDQSPETWESFTLAGHPGFVRTGEEPTVLLFVDRFRIQVDAPGQAAADAEWLRDALDAIELDRLAQLAELLPAPSPARDPLLGQPELAEPARLAEALPAEVAGMPRGEVNSQVVSYMGEPFDTSRAQASYAPADDGPSVTVSILDQGMVTHDVAQDRAAMEPVEANGRTFYVSEDATEAMTVVGDRIVVALRAQEGSGLDADGLVAALASVDLASLAEVAPAP